MGRGGHKKKIFEDVYINDIPLYGVWHTMKQRCHNPNDKRYPYYGGRGISVCPSWKDNFIKFYNWAIKKGYKKGLTIDRRNNDGNYSPINCRLATMIEQAANKRNSALITYNGKAQSISQWAKELGVTRYEAKKLINYKPKS